MLIDTKYILPKNGVIASPSPAEYFFYTLCSLFNLYPVNMNQFICKHVIQLEWKTAQISIR